MSEQEQLQSDSIQKVAPPKTIDVYARALVRLGDRLLFVSSDNTNWELPGGKLEPGLDMVSCIEEQVYQKAGLYIKPGRLFAVYEVHDEKNNIFRVENIFFSRFKENIVEKNVDELKLKMPYHGYFTLDQIIKDDKVTPRFLEYGDWVNQDKATVKAVYQGVV